MVADMDKKPGHRALRAGRISQQNGIYLVTFVTQERRPIFRDFHLACAACATFAGSANQELATLLAWVLMPDHFHGLIRLDANRPLPRVGQRMKSAASKACRAHQPGIAIWARAFHDHALRKDEDLRHAARYLIANPIRAGLVEHVHDYPFWDAVWL
ncbi:MAG TPA: transposase [Rhodanobacteraceae bacterium]|nr:transposase [Rhodanobacteraceae bacterium]